MKIQPTCISEPVLVRYLLPIWFTALPFTYALTINFGFPLKIYEIISFILLIYLSVRSVRRNTIKTCLLDNRVFLSLSTFLLSMSCSFLFGAILIKWSFPVIPTWAYGFNSPFARSFLKILYVAIDIFSLMVVVRYAKYHQKKYLDYYLLGALMASFYAIYLFISRYNQFEPYLLPGIDPNQNRFWMWGIDFIRHGTFKEGNHFSLYLLLATVLAFYGFERFNQTLYLLVGGLFLLTTLTTFSTVGVVLCVGFLCLYFLRKIFTVKNKGIVFFLLMFFITATVAIASIINRSSYYQIVINEKIFGENNLSYSHNKDLKEDMSYSKNERIRQFLFALFLFREYPILGVGPNNFGLFYEEAYQTKAKSIPNNVYSEILSEGGGTAFFLFLASLFLMVNHLVKKIKNKGVDVLIGGFFLIFISWMAYPSFIVMFIWAYFGLSISLSTDNAVLPKKEI